MTSYQATSRRTRTCFIAASLAVAVGLLELVSGSMAFPDPAAVTFRAETLAAEAERAREIRSNDSHPVLVAATGSQSTR